MKEISLNDNNGLATWNQSQMFYLQELALAYAEWFIITSNHNRIKNFNFQNDKDTEKILTDLLRLFGLNALNKDLAIFREGDFISGDAVYFIRDEILSLTKQLKNEFIPITDVIAPPDHIMFAVFGKSTEQDIYKEYYEKVISFDKAVGRVEWWEALREINK
jgi:hypothetical protein